MAEYQAIDTRIPSPYLFQDQDAQNEQDPLSRLVAIEIDEPVPTHPDASEHVSQRSSYHDHNHARQKPTLLESNKKLEEIKLSKPSLFRDWGEEIASVVFSLICTSLAFAVLFYMDSRSLAEWKLQIQPNTAIAILSTLTRASLIFPLSECIGQSKWLFFEKSRSLHSMQTFDSASRGPMGAIVFLWKARFAAPLTTGAAIVTFLLLLFQPFMQQTIVYSSRPAPISQEIAAVTRAIQWAYDDFNKPQSPCRYRHHNVSEATADPIIVFPAISYGLYRAVTNEPALDPINAYCSAPRCDFPDFDTLGICAICEDQELSDVRLEDYDNCTLYKGSNQSVVHPTQQDIQLEIDEHWGHRDLKAKLTCSKGHFWFDLVIDYGTYAAEPPEILFTIYPFGFSDQRPNTAATWSSRGPAMLLHSFSTSTASIDTSVSIESMGLRSCIYITPSASPGDPYRPHDILQASCFDYTTNLEKYFDWNQTSPRFGSINGTITTCSLKPCGKHYSLVQARGGKVNAVMAHSTTTFYNSSDVPKPDLPDMLYNMSPSGEYTHSTRSYCADGEQTCQYSWNILSMDLLGSWIKTIMMSEEFTGFLTAWPSPFGRNFTALYHRFADELSLPMQQSRVNVYATNITGIAYGTEIYVHVEWLWVILPIFLLGASATVLIFTILSSNNRSYLFKNKVLAAIFMRLDGWETSEYMPKNEWNHQSMKRLEETSKGMTARLHVPTGDRDGYLKLRKE
jgi:hypothetical protein